MNAKQNNNKENIFNKNPEKEKYDKSFWFCTIYYNYYASFVKHKVNKKPEKEKV